jgi:hypothetical protein
MRPIGFSTGAVARSDFRSALDQLCTRNVQVVELSALRLPELKPLVDAIEQLDLSRFSFVSFHAPSQFLAAEEAFVVKCLMRIVSLGVPIVVHPDAIYTDERWNAFGGALFIENMDKRKPIGRTAKELSGIFARFPNAGLCFDIGHARQVDPTMVEAHRILTQHGARLRQIHMSEVNTASRHEPMSEYAIRAFQRVAWMIPSDIPTILETLIDEGQSDISTEIRKARRALAEIPELSTLAG